MLRQMERSAVQLLSKRGKSIRQIAAELGRSPTTIARVLKEPVDQLPSPRHRQSKLDPYRAQIEGWLRQGLTAVRMLELARGDPEMPYTGSRSHFGEYVRRVRQEQQQQQAASDVPIRFEGLPGEYLQVDWGEVRRFPFTQLPAQTRYFLACRLKYSRWSWVRWTTDMRQETLFRGLIDCFLALGWVPWVLVFDNMKTVTSGRDGANQPVWTPALLQLAAEFGFHPEACAYGAGNQKDLPAYCTSVASVRQIFSDGAGHPVAGRRCPVRQASWPGWTDPSTRPKVTQHVHHRPAGRSGHGCAAHQPAARRWVGWSVHWSARLGQRHRPPAGAAACACV